MDSQTGQKLFSTHEISSKISFKECRETDNNTASITWHSDIARLNEDGDHKTVLKYDLLYHQYEHAARDVSLPATIYRFWGRRKMSELISSETNVASFEAFLSDGRTFESVLHSLAVWGLVLFRDVPHDESSIEKLGERIGPLRNTFYGRTWDVKDDPNSQNIAYTSRPLQPHADLLYVPWSNSSSSPYFADVL